MSKFVIRGPVVDGEPLYWSNVDGWGARIGATVFDNPQQYDPLEATGREYVSDRKPAKQSTKPKTPTLRAELKRAYSDDYAKRQLVFLASRPVSPAVLAKTLPAIVPAYNDFDARPVCDWLAANFPNVEVWIGREYSPAMYIAGSPADLAAIAADADSMLLADEVQIYKGGDQWSTSLSGHQFQEDVIRLWWD